ncbi:hypothetical protein EI77_01211 [Prosthecobacter fusiformis]|uniref:Uncharacterized protein n=1 Tax=Prosthecobacter fusiformis TaxID=48464 RepID=A0A4R7ST67_9BACT|nr:hypothetical protein [Prosthecobacter fusiformis]TDU81899.1 hypothetical protein EI77_01211 [Prosthecobacter fusiformis]
MTADPRRLHQLFCACTDGRLTPEENIELQECLRNDVTTRRLWFAHVDLEDGLHDLIQSCTVTAAPVAEVRSWKGRLRPLLAAAAGLAMGLFSASMVFGFGLVGKVQTLSLLNDSFETGTNPFARGKPIAPGRWSGDFTEVVGPHDGIRPADGKKMLRFLRGDDELAHLPDSSSSDTFRLLDMRRFKGDIADGSGVVRLSAMFNATAEEASTPISCTLMLYALDAKLVKEIQAGGAMPNLRRNVLAFSQSSRVKLDNGTQSWQSASNELRLPPETDYLMIQIGVSHDSKESGKRLDTFGNHYADQVRVSLARLPEVPLP